jgi:type I restriction enzyme S subunit
MKLFETTIGADQLDPTYVYIRDGEYCAEARNYLEALWKEFEPLADPDFHEQAQMRSNFQGRMWEMRLAIVLKRIGLPVDRSPRKGGPDVMISSSPRIWIEAVAPHSTDFLDRNEEQAKRSATRVPEAEVILRYTSALKEKWNAYERYRQSGCVRADDVFVVAVSGANLPCPTLGNGPHWMAKPLYGLGNIVFQIEVGTGRNLGSTWRWIHERATASGAPVDSDLFLSPKRAGLSAVLYTEHHVQNWPELRGRAAGSDFRLFHNPFAATPLAIGFIPRGEEWGVDGDAFRCLNDFTTVQAG